MPDRSLRLLPSFPCHPNGAIFLLGTERNYNHEIMIFECDSEIRLVYNVKSVKDIKDRINIRGGTRFTLVFEYANHHKVDLLVFFTDGKGEEY